jgi:hypothetical protein
MEALQSLAQNVVALYSTDTDYAGVRKIIEENYTEDAVFQDAVVSVKGRENIIAQVIWRRGLFNNSSTISVSAFMIRMQRRNSYRQPVVPCFAQPSR